VALSERITSDGRHRLLSIALALGGWLLPLLQASADPPRRIVSLNLCTDQLVMLLSAPERIAALSFLARDQSLSAMASEAERFASVRGDAEEVLRLDPDLVLAGPLAARATVDLLKRLGRRVVSIPLAEDLAGISQSLRLVGEVVGEQARAEQLAVAFEARLATLARDGEARRPRPTALVYHVAGLASGKGSLPDHALTAAGFANAAGRMPLDARGALQLEVLITNPPDLLVLAQTGAEYRTVQADNLRHPTLRRLTARVPTVHVPQRLWICGTPHVADAIELLAEARARLEARR
jgi:iron complex transport system substrate-binding protein